MLESSYCAVRLLLASLLIGLGAAIPKLFLGKIYESNVELCEYVLTPSTQMEVLSFWTRSPTAFSNKSFSFLRKSELDFAGQPIIQAKVGSGDLNTTAIGSEYVTYKGYFWVAFVFNKSSNNNESNCALKYVMMDDMSTQTTAEPSVEYVSVANYLSLMIPNGSYNLDSASGVLTIGYSTPLSNIAKEGSPIGRLILSRAIFEFGIDINDWKDAGFMRAIRFGMTHSHYQRLSYDLPYTPQQSISTTLNGEYLTGELAAINRNNTRGSTGLLMKIADEVAFTRGIPPNSGTAALIHIYNFKELLQVFNASITMNFRTKYWVSGIADGVLGDVNVTFGNDGSEGLTIQLSAVFTLNNTLVLTNQSAEIVGSLRKSDITNRTTIYMISSANYHGNPSLDGNWSNVGYCHFYVAAIADWPYQLTSTPIKRMDATLQLPFNMTLPNFTLLEVTSLVGLVRLMKTQPPSIDYDIRMMESLHLSSLLDWKAILPGFSYNQSYAGLCFRETPPAYRGLRDNSTRNCFLTTLYETPEASQVVANCASSWVTRTNCARCLPGMYPDITNYRELPMNTSCKKKDECQTTPGFVYVNNYEGTPFDYRGMCLSCPPNCINCSADLTCTSCILPYTDSSHPRCACKVANCMICRDSYCDVCDPRYALHRPRGEGDVFCQLKSSGCRQGYSVDTNFSYEGLKVNYIRLCIPCMDSQCRICTNSYTACTAWCPSSGVMVDFLIALYPDKANVTNCTLTSQTISGMVFNSTAFVPCIKNCSKCLPSNVSDCEVCVNSTTFMVDNLTCTSDTTCPNGTYPESSKRFRCWNCIPFCSYCLNGSQDCLTCIPGYIYLEGSKSCIPTSQCNAQYFRSAVQRSKNGIPTNVCISCMSNCLSCASEQTCSQCATGSYYHVDRVSNINLCIPCGRSCKRCTSNVECQECTSTANVFQVDDNMCIPSTSCLFGSGNFQSGGLCYSCLTFCAFCSRADICITCRTGKYLSSSKTACDDACPAGESQVGTTQQCVVCPPGCQACSADGKVCTVCSMGLNLLPNNTCQNCLTPGFSLVGAVCKPCSDSNCKLCVTDPNKCTECKPTYLLANATCGPCMDPMFIDIEGVCHSCAVQDCAKCVNTSLTCGTCATGYSREGGKCILANFKVISASFDRIKSTLKIVFEQKLLDDDYSSAMMVEFKYQNGTKVDFKIEEIFVHDGKLNIKITSPASFSSGEAKIIFSNPGKYLSADKPGYTLSSNSSGITVSQVSMNYPQVSSAQQISQAAGGSAMSLLTIAAFVVSANYAIMLIKIYQMMDFMLLYNLDYPDNFDQFISIFRASNPLDALPDMLSWLHSEGSCPPMGQKFIDQKVSCQFISNASTSVIIIIGWLFLIAVFKLAVKIIDLGASKPDNSKEQIGAVDESKDVLAEKDEDSDEIKHVETKLTIKQKCIKFIKETSIGLSSSKAVFILVQSLDIDIALAVAVNLKYYAGDRDRSFETVVNSLLSGTILVGHPILIGYFYYRTRSMLTNYTKENAFLLEGRHSSNQYQIYREVFTMTRNLLVCLLVVWLYETPLLQIGLLTAIVTLSAYLEVKYKVFESKIASFASGVLWLLYSGSSFLFLVAKVLENVVSTSTLKVAIGVPLIILFGGVIAINFVPSIFELVHATREKCRKAERKRQEADFQIQVKGNAKTNILKANSGQPKRIIQSLNNDITLNEEDKNEQTNPKQVENIPNKSAFTTTETKPRVIGRKMPEPITSRKQIEMRESNRSLQKHTSIKTSTSSKGPLITSKSSLSPTTSLTRGQNPPTFVDSSDIHKIKLKRTISPMQAAASMKSTKQN